MISFDDTHCFVWLPWQNAWLRRGISVAATGYTKEFSSAGIWSRPDAMEATDRYEQPFEILTMAQAQALHRLHQSTC